MANQGGDGRKDGRTDGRLEIPPVSYRTSALWGRCPKRSIETNDRKKKKKEEKEEKEKDKYLVKDASAD